MNEQFDDYIAGNLSEEERQAFEKQLADNPDLLNTFIEQRQIDLSLYYLHNESSNSVGIDAILADLKAGDDKPFKKSVLNEILEEKQSKRKPIYYALSALAACFLVGILVFINQAPSKKDSDLAPEVTPQIELVARIVQQKKVQWNEKTTSIKQNGWLSTGKVHLDSGVLKIVFDNGARVVLRGPVDFDLISSERGFLNSGKSWARVPKQARGFTIHTPNSTMIDLGTVFTLNVEDNEKTELHVVKGEVKALIDNDKGTADVHHVKEKEAIAIQGKKKKGKAKRILFNLQHMNNNLPIVQSPDSSYVHYPFDQQSKTIDDMGTYIKQFRGQYVKIRKKKKAKHQFHSTKGPFKGAVDFPSGDNNIIRTSFDGIAGTQARTIAFWVKVKPNEKIEYLNPIVHWGQNKSGSYWLTSINHDRRFGKIGAIRTQFGQSGMIVGSTDIRDGRWHHIACVFIGGDKANVASHIRHYVDGKLEGISHKRGGVVNTLSKLLDRKAAKLTLGYFHYHKPHRQKKKRVRKHLTFSGSMDEFYFFDQALDHYQLVHLMDQNEFITAPAFVSN